MKRKALPAQIMGCMPHREEDLAFARFQRTKDPAELARVFDLTAGSLLLVAMHLTRNESDAEDLLQGTFLSAIEGAGRYDPSRPVLAWLTGILTLEARMAGRRARRALPDAELREEPGPVHAAERQELALDLAAAIQGLPDAYRTVLMLRFVHGLRSVQIARTLNRSPETVRTQVRRGLELLRKALPRGLAIPAVLVLAGRGLAAVRAEVLARASAVPIPVATVSVLGGVLLMKKTVSVLLLAVLGGVLALVGWSIGSAPAEGDPGGRFAVVAAAEAPDSRVAAPAGEPAVARRSVEIGNADESAGNRTQRGEPLATLRGRCVALEDGKPLSGCTVSLQGEDRSWKRKAGSDPRSFRAPAPVVSGADGSFELRFVAEDELRLRLEIREAGRVPLIETFEGYSPGASVDLGDVRLWAGASVTGSVVDPKGSPVARATVRIRVHRLKLDGGPINWSKPDGTLADAAVVLSTRSTEDGRLEFPDLVPVGTWPLEVDAAEGFELVGPLALRVLGQKTVSDLSVVVRDSSLPLISGSLVDELGGPVRGVVEARELRGLPVSEAQTDPDGAFTLAPVGRWFEQGTANTAQSVRLVCWVGGWKHEFGARTFPWGTRDVRFVIPTPRSGSAEVVVVEADGGKPVEDYAMRSGLDRLTEDTWSKPWSDEWVPFARHPGGTSVLEGLVAGNRILFVIPRDPALHASAAIAFTSTPGAVARVRVELQRSVEHRFRVVRKDGSPQVAARLELIRSWGRRDAEPRWSVPVLLDEVLTRHGPRTCCLVDRGTTDEQGSVRLRGPASREGLSLRLYAGHAQSLHDVAALQDDGGVITIVVPMGATLRGRVRPAGLLPSLDARIGIERVTLPGPGIMLKRLEADRGFLALPGRGRSFKVAADGSFRIEGLPSGSFEGCMVLPGAKSPVAWGRFSLDEGETKELDLDLGSWIPGRIKGRIRVNGEPLVNASWVFRRQKGSWERIEGRPVTDGEGRFELRSAIPARYQLEVQWRNPQTGRSLTLEAPDWIEVRPGEEVERTFDLERRTLRIRVTESDGKTPARRTRLMLWDQEKKTDVKEQLTDDDGVLLLDPAPHAPIELGVFKSSDDRFSALMYMFRPDWPELEQRLHVIGTAACPAGASEAEARFVLPPAGGG